MTSLRVLNEFLLYIIGLLCTRFKFFLEVFFMNRDLILCRTVMERPSVTQRELAPELNLSLGTVNGLVKDAIQSQLSTQSDNGLYQMCIRDRYSISP